MGSLFFVKKFFGSPNAECWESLQSEGFDVCVCLNGCTLGCRLGEDGRRGLRDEPPPPELQLKHASMLLYILLLFYVLNGLVSAFMHTSGQLSASTVSLLIVILVGCGCVFISV